MEFVEVVLNSAAIFIMIMILIRLLGKKELGQLSTFDLVVILIIADIGSISLENRENFLNTIVIFIVLYVLQKLFSFLLLHFSVFRTLFDGSPVIIVSDGVMNLKIMRKELYTVDDLINQMRQKNVMCIKDIKLAILETSGDLSVFEYNKFDEIILPVVISGKICKDMLKYIDINEDRLRKMFSDKNLNIKDTYYASSNGKELFINETRYA